MSVVQMLEHLILTIPSYLEEIKEEEALHKINRESWSKQEILGHLCDSATNNHMRFVKIILASDPLRIEKYQKNQWVALHGYSANYTYRELITLWTFLNRQVLYVLKNGNAEDLTRPVILDDEITVTLGWLIEDYVNHLQHHMKQITGKNVTE